MNRFFSTFLLVGLCLIMSLVAQANNQEIVIQAVVPGTYELTVYDINQGYDLDLSDDSGEIHARIGSIHVFSNELTQAGACIYVESANAGRLVNSSTIPGIAAENVKYKFVMSVNDLMPNSLSIDFAQTSLSLDTDGGWENNLNELLVPGEIHLGSSETTDGIDQNDQALFDIIVMIPGTNRPKASGIYSDTIRFTIMDNQ